MPGTSFRLRLNRHRRRSARHDHRTGVARTIRGVLVGSVWYLRSGIVDLPRYGATQSAMLMAATCGVVLAAIMRETPWTETDSAGALIAGTISFAMVDSLIRMRDRLLVADNVNHYAILGCAMFAAILAGVIGRRHRIPVERPL